MVANLQALNIRLPVDLIQQLDLVRQMLARRLPGATRTDAVRYVLQRGLDNFEEDKMWMDSDWSRLGEFEPYDFGGVDPMQLGKPVQHLRDGSLLTEKNS